MDRFWQWAWDRYGSRYVWVITIAAFASALPVYLIWSRIVLAVEKSSRYGAAAAVAVVVVLGMSLLTNLPGASTYQGWFSTEDTRFALHAVMTASYRETGKSRS